MSNYFRSRNGVPHFVGPFWGNSPSATPQASPVELQDEIDEKALRIRQLETECRKLREENGKLELQLAARMLSEDPDRPLPTRGYSERAQGTARAVNKFPPDGYDGRNESKSR